MDAAEQRQFSDIVKVVNRTAERLEWMYDSVLYSVDPQGTTLLPRFIAIAGVERHPLKRDRITNLVVDSLIGIEEIPGKTTPPGELSFKTTPLNVDVKEVADSDKLELDGEKTEGNEKLKLKVDPVQKPMDNFTENNAP